MSVVATSEELKDEVGRKIYLARVMSEPTMLSNYPDERQRYALANFSYQTSKDKAATGNLGVKVNIEATSNALLKIKTNCIKETEVFKDDVELAKQYLKANGINKYQKWFLGINRTQEVTFEGQTYPGLCYPITSDFQNVDIGALEKIMEVAASVDDKDLANKASDLLTLALKKKNGESLSTFTFFPGIHSVTLEASI